MSTDYVIDRFVTVIELKHRAKTAVCTFMCITREAYKQPKRPPSFCSHRKVRQNLSDAVCTSKNKSTLMHPGVRCVIGHLGTDSKHTQSVYWTLAQAHLRRTAAGVLYTVQMCHWCPMPRRGNVREEEARRQRVPRGHFTHTSSSVFCNACVRTHAYTDTQVLK